MKTVSLGYCSGTRKCFISSNMYSIIIQQLQTHVVPSENYGINNLDRTPAVILQNNVIVVGQAIPETKVFNQLPHNAAF